MLTNLEEQQMIDLAKKMGSQWTPGLYNALAPKFALTAIETVFLRMKEDGSAEVEVLLARRLHSDAHYPNQWHSPGTMLRAVDVPEETEMYLGIPELNGFRKALDRLVNSELGLRFKGEPRQVKSILHFTPRGPEAALIFLCELDGEPKFGEFFSVNQLPSDLIEHHYRIIKVAVDNFKE